MSRGWSFGIVTDGSQVDRVQMIIDSIWDDFRHMPDAFEIIVVGGANSYRYPMQPSRVHWRHIPFDETAKARAWISRKKNLIADHATFDNICLMHDYVAIDPGWAEGFDRFGDDWNSCMNKIVNVDGSRFRDWCMIDNDGWPPAAVARALEPYDIPCPGPGLISYYHPGVPRWQYFSGAYFTVKREALLKVPLDEDKCWSQGEDVEWSRRMFLTYGDKAFSLNPHSSVRLLKYKPSAPWEKQVPYRGN